MVIKFATFDPAQDPNDFNPAFPPTPSSSPSVTLCQPCEYTYTFTKTIVTRLVAAGASLVLKAPASEFDGHVIQDRHSETPFPSINFNVDPDIRQRQLKEFTLKELEVASQNFSAKKLIGRGGFGDVYEGQLADGSLVAIKRHNAQGAQGASEFEGEVTIGSIIPRHHNLLPILGLCRTSNCRDLLLVFPLMINKSVDHYFRPRPGTQPQLDWLTRRKIVLGTARGLSLLHDLNIVHRDIKLSNILLDEELEPYIGDFGLVKFTNRRHSGYSVDGIKKAPVLPRNESEAGSNSEDSYFTRRVVGTYGYMAPEYAIEGIYSVKTDVFAFGVTLLELMTGRRLCSFREPANGRFGKLDDWVKRNLVEGSWEIIVDSDLQGEYDQEEMEKVIQLALLCTQTVPRRRPSMAQVVRILKGHSIDERWEEYRHSEEYLTPSFPYQSEHVSSSSLNPEVLSEPR